MVNIKSMTVAAAALLGSSLAVPFVREGSTASIASQHGKPIPGNYIVTLKDGSTQDVDTHIAWVNSVHARSLNKRDSHGVSRKYKGSFKGYAGNFDDSTLAEIRNNADVSRN